MSKKISDNTEAISLAKIAGLLIPMIIMFYSIFISDSILRAENRQILFLGLSCVWVIEAFLQFFFSYERASLLFKLIFNHIMMILFAVFIIGFSPPMVIAWLVLFTETTVTMDNKAGILSMISLFLAFVARISFNEMNSTEIVNVIVFFMLLMLVCYFALRVISTFKESQKKLAESRSEEASQRERLAAVINNLTDAVIAINRQGIVTLYNAATLNLLDTNDNPTGNHISEVLKLTKGDGKKFDIFKKLKSLSSVEVIDDLKYKIDNDDSLRLETTMSPIKNAFSEKRKAQVQGYIIILRDVTKAKTLEEEKDEFIGVVSHELRTPVTIAEGSLSNLLLLTKKGVTDSPLYAENLDTAHEQVVFLAKMINDLSTLSRAERSVMSETEEISVKELIDKMYIKYLGEAEEKGLELNVDTSGSLGKIKTSRLYLEETIQNFITNAIKYTPKGSVTIGAKKSKGEVIFFVKDTGIGIGKADRDKVFDKFYRSEDYRTRETNGTGLGLYISNKLAKMMNGRLELESRLNQGSTFSLVLKQK